MRLLVLLCVALWALPGAARADVASCVAAAEQGQVQRDERALAAARASFLTCAAAGCPGAVRRECAAWLADVEARLPSLVIVARDEAGHDLAGVQVWLDDSELAPDALGHELTLDPGSHRLIARLGERESELEIVASEREKGRLVTLVLPAPAAEPEAPVEAPPPPPEPAGRPWLGPVITLSAGALLLGSAGLLTLKARSDADALRDDCAPTCGASEVDALQSRLLVADVLLVTGAVAVAAGVTWWLWPRKQKPSNARLRITPVLALGVRKQAHAVGLEGKF